MGSGVRRIAPLTLGWEDLPKSVSVEGAPAERLREPVPAVLLECDGGWLLLDTGFNTALIRDLALRRRFHGDPEFTPGHDPVMWPALTAELAAARGLVRPP